MGVVSGAIQSLANVGIAQINKQGQREYNNAYLRGIQETNAANMRLAEKQNEWNLDQWYRENEYNAPQKQVQRLKDAGLSSAAASQALEGAGNAGNIQSADLANQVAPQQLTAPQFDLSAVPNLLGMMRELVEMRKTKTETELKEKENNFFNRVMMTDLDAKRADIEFKKFELFKAHQSWPYSFQALKYNTNAAAYNPAIQAEELENRRLNNDMIDQNVKLARQQFDWLDKMHEQEFKEMLAKIRNLEKQYEVYESQINKNNAEAGLAIAQTETEGEKKKLTKAQYISQGLDIILKEYGSPESVAGRTGAMYAAGVLGLNEIDNALIGIKSYVKHGKRTLDVDSDTEDYFYYIFDEGKAKAGQTPLRTLGATREFWNLMPFVDVDH